MVPRSPPRTQPVREDSTLYRPSATFTRMSENQPQDPQAEPAREGHPHPARMAVDEIPILRKAPDAELYDVMDGDGRREVLVHDHGLVALVDVMPRVFRKFDGNTWWSSMPCSAISLPVINAWVWKSRAPVPDPRIRQIVPR